MTRRTRSLAFLGVTLCLFACSSEPVEKDRPAPVSDSSKATPSNAPTSAVDGLWTATLFPESGTAEPIMDAVLFDHGTLLSRYFESRGFGAAPYTLRTEPDGSEMALSATQVSSSAGRMQWQLSGSRPALSGTVVVTDPDGTKRTMNADLIEQRPTPLEGTWTIAFDHGGGEGLPEAEDVLTFERGRFASKWFGERGYAPSAFVIVRGAPAPNSFRAVLEKGNETLVWTGYTEDGVTLNGMVRRRLSPDPTPPTFRGKRVKQ